MRQRLSYLNCVSTLRFNARTPGGVRPQRRQYAPDAGRVSIHAPRAGCDHMFSGENCPSSVFQSTHPGQGATCSLTDTRQYLGVSIHAPQAGCDQASSTGKNGTLSFNPRTPGGVRHWLSQLKDTDKCFNPRTPGGVRLTWLWL